MNQKFEDGDKVKVIAAQDFKYQYVRAGVVGEVFDVFQSDKSGDFVYEVEFPDAGYRLVFQEDLEKA